MRLDLRHSEEEEPVDRLASFFTLSHMPRDLPEVNNGEFAEIENHLDELTARVLKPLLLHLSEMPIPLITNNPLYHTLELIRGNIESQNHLPELVRALVACPVAERRQIVKLAKKFGLIDAKALARIVEAIRFTDPQDREEVVANSLEVAEVIRFIETALLKGEDPTAMVIERMRSARTAMHYFTLFPEYKRYAKIIEAAHSLPDKADVLTHVKALLESGYEIPFLIQMISNTSKEYRGNLVKFMLENRGSKWM